MKTGGAELILEDGVIDGRRAARIVRQGVEAQVEALKDEGVHPRVVFLRVGDDPASEVYVNAKARACGWVGIRSDHVSLPAGTSATEMAEVIQALNDDDDVDAILIQLPLPAPLDPMVLNLIDPNKDVDGFHPMNLGALMAGRGPLEPCTPAGVIRLLMLLGIEDLKGKEAVVVGRSVIVGRPMAVMLHRAHATVTSCHRHTRDLREHVGRADVLVVATGVNGLIRGDWIKPGALVFDVGITLCEDGVLRGDVCFEEALGRAAGVTPVPGGVGPMTIAQLLDNTVRCARIRRGLDPSGLVRA